MGGGVIWVEFDGVAEFLFGAIPIPVVGRTNHCERDVGFGEGIVESNGFFGGGASFGERIAGRGFAPIVEKIVRIGEAGVGESEVGIGMDGLFEIRNALLQAWFA